MDRPEATRREPVRVRLGQDIARMAVFAALLGAPLAVTLRLPSVGPAWLDSPLRAAGAVVAHLIALGLVRAIVPRPIPGDHRVTPGGPFLRQALSRALSEVAFLSLFRGPLWLLHFGRVLHLDLLGAKIAWDVGLPIDLRVREPALFSVGPGSVLESGVVIEASTLRAGRAHVAAVQIGARCVIGSQVLLLPGVSIAHDVRVEPGALLADDVRVGVSAVIGPGSRLSRGVTVGAHASIGAGAVLAEGVTLGERARVAAGAFVPAGTQIVDHARYPHRES